MKKITILLVIIFTFLFSTTSWGEWTYVSVNVSGDKLYYDKDRIRKSGKYLYFWELGDYHKPLGTGFLSSTTYHELDCSIFRYKILRIQFYKKYLILFVTTEESVGIIKARYQNLVTSVEVGGLWKVKLNLKEFLTVRQKDGLFTL